MKYLVLIESKTEPNNVLCYCKDGKAAEKVAVVMLKEWRNKYGTLNDTRCVLAKIEYCIEG